MDRLAIFVSPELDPTGNPIFSVMINGKICPADDYSLDWDSFFAAIGVSAARIRFLGGCGIFDCCGLYLSCYSMSDCWRWTALGEFDNSTQPEFWYVDWSDVIVAAEQVIGELELWCHKEFYGFLTEKLHEYRAKLADLRQSVADSSFGSTA